MNNYAFSTENTFQYFKTDTMNVVIIILAVSKNVNYYIFYWLNKRSEMIRVHHFFTKKLSQIS